MIPVGNAPVVVKNTCVPEASQCPASVTTHGEAIVIVGFPIATCPVSEEAPEAEAIRACLFIIDH